MEKETHGVLLSISTTLEDLTENQRVQLDDMSQIMAQLVMSSNLQDTNKLLEDLIKTHSNCMVDLTDAINNLRYTIEKSLDR